MALEKEPVPHYLFDVDSIPLVEQPQADKYVFEIPSSNSSKQIFNLERRRKHLRVQLTKKP